MSLMTLLDQAQAGALFANVARGLDLDGAETQKAMRQLCPAIAARLKQKAAADENLFQTLLDLIEDKAPGSLLDDADALTAPEAIADGNAILDDVYGSRNDAMVALREAGPAIPERELSKLAPISATAVVAALAAANRPLGLAAPPSRPAAARRVKASLAPSSAPSSRASSPRSPSNSPGAAAGGAARAMPAPAAAARPPQAAPAPRGAGPPMPRSRMSSAIFAIWANASGASSAPGATEHPLTLPSHAGGRL